MPPIRANPIEIADYVASMLDELAKLCQPLRNEELASLLSISADLARQHAMVPIELTQVSGQEPLLPRRRKVAASAAIKKMKG